MGKAGRANRLRVWRADRRIIQIELAHRTKINVARLSEIENGYRQPTDAQKKKLARALKVTVGELFPDAPPDEQAAS
jgi:transcriptional regulator with XRE-family HTH domain